MIAGNDFFLSPWLLQQLPTDAPTYHTCPSPATLFSLFFLKRVLPASVNCVAEQKGRRFGCWLLCHCETLSPLTLLSGNLILPEIETLSVYRSPS